VSCCTAVEKLRVVTCSRVTQVRVPLYSGGKVANRNVWEIALTWPISLYTTVARTHMNTYAAKVWDLSIVQGPFSVAPCQALALRFATFAVCCSCATNRFTRALPPEPCTTPGA
jgi:hypothetical protein